MNYMLYEVTYVSTFTSVHAFVYRCMRDRKTDLHFKPRIIHNLSKVSNRYSNLAFGSSFNIEAFCLMDRCFVSQLRLDLSYNVLRVI